MAKRGTLDNPKTKRLARSLGVVPGVALGLLETIWHFAGEFKKDGGFSALDIEDALDSGGWLGMFSVEKVIAAMTDASRECVWLEPLGDGRYYIHDWHAHAEDNIHKSLAREVKFFANGMRPNTSRLDKGERPVIESKLDECARSAPGVRPECALDVNLSSESAPCQAMPGHSHIKKENARAKTDWGMEVPTVEEISLAFQLAGNPDPQNAAQTFFQAYASVGWLDGNGNKITDWRMKIGKWNSGDASRKAQASGATPKPGKVPKLANGGPVEAWEGPIARILRDDEDRQEWVSESGERWTRSFGIARQFKQLVKKLEDAA